MGAEQDRRGGSAKHPPLDQSLERFLRGLEPDAVPWDLWPAPIRITRARDFHFYDSTGVRYTDFWQANGGAVFGHRPRRLARVVKDQLERGLWVPAPTPWESRARTQLRRTARSLGFVPAGAQTASDSDRSTMYRYLRQDALKHLHDQIKSGRVAVEVRVWRPFGTFTGYEIESPERASESPERADVIVMAVPVPLTGLPVPVLCTSTAGQAAVDETSELVRTQFAPAPHEWAALVHVLSSLPHAIESDHTARLSLAERLPLPGNVERWGIYLFPTGDWDRERWRGFSAAARDLRIVVPGRPDAGMVIPGTLSEHEIRNWSQLCDRFGA